MLLRLRNSSSTAHLFKSVLNGCVTSQKHNWSPSVGYCGIQDERLTVLSSKLLQEATLANTHKLKKCFFSSEETQKALDRLTFENICAETLDSLTEYFEELVETNPKLKNADVVYSDGVLTVSLGKSFGTYVINRQTPNLQIWLSSPISGPKRYDYVDGTWIYKHDQTTLHSLLDCELQEIADAEVQFVKKCLHSKALM